MSETVVKIRARDRVLSSPPAGQRQSWTEYQVVLGRKVIHRADFRYQAEKWAIEHGYTIENPQP